MADRSALVTIQIGSASAPPLFCVGGEEGNVRLYYALASHLPPEQPVYGLVAPMDRRDEPQHRLERMGERHLRDIRLVAPGGPYVIAGECTGGALAYEIARQARAAGEEAVLLVLVDAFRPGLPRLPWFMPRPAYTVIHLVRILGFHCGNLARIDMQAKLDYVASRAGRVSNALLARASSVLRRSGEPVTPRLAFREALAAYDPAPYPGATVLFRAARLPFGIEAAPDLGWASLIENLQIELVPGYFTTPISEPGVRVLAELLERQVRLCASRS
jgi:thioesterase domain-containing protein